MLQLMESRPQQGKVDKIIEEEGNVGVCSIYYVLILPISSKTLFSSLEKKSREDRNRD